MPTRWLLGLPATPIHDELTNAYGQGVVSYRSACSRHYSTNY
jgi:hypothetical protein